MDIEGTNSDTQIRVRVLTQADHARLVRIDERLTGRSRGEWYRRKLKIALQESAIAISLGAEIDGTLVGGLMGSVQYGEFGSIEPVAVLDTLIVDPGFNHRGVGKALIEQLVNNLRGLRVERIRTEVGWTELQLMGFLAKAGFQPTPRLVLELKLD